MQKIQYIRVNFLITIIIVIVILLIPEIPEAVASVV